MKKGQRAVVVGLFVLGVMGLLLACTTGGQTEELDKYTGKYTKSLEKVESLQAEIDDQAGKINTDPEDPEGWRQQKSRGEEIKKKLEEQKTLTQSAVNDIKKAQELDIDSDYKQYLSLLEKHQEKALKYIDIRITLWDGFIQFMAKVVAGSVSAQEIMDYSAFQDEYQKKGEATMKEAEALKAKADKFYEDKKLGED